MAKVFLVVIGLALIALGVWGAVAWSDAVLMLLEALAVVAAIFTGLVLVVFTASELRAPEPPQETPAVSADGHEASP